MQASAPNATIEQNLATASFFRPLGVSGIGGSSGLAPSTSLSSTLFAQPLFQGLPNLPDDSTEEAAATAPGLTSLYGKKDSAGVPGLSSLGGGSGLIFGPLGGGGG